MRIKNSSLITGLTVTFFVLLALASAPTNQQASITKYDGIFKYTPGSDEVVTNKSKLEFIKAASNPTIVLRVPDANKGVLEEDKNVKSDGRKDDGNNSLYNINVYNIIEKELLKGGFTVRDRALFQKVLGDKSVNDYSKIKELTETDLILELSTLEYVGYPFNSFGYTLTGRRNMDTRSSISCSNSIVIYGLKLEFRLIKVKENDFIGSFTYYHSMCPDNTCVYSVNVNNNTRGCSDPFLQQGNLVYTGKNLISQPSREAFVKQASQKLVDAIMSR
jgi:hypothetical protein